MSGSFARRVTMPRPMSINIAQYCPGPNKSSIAPASQRTDNKVKSQSSIAPANLKTDNKVKGQRSNTVSNRSIDDVKGQDQPKIHSKSELGNGARPKLQNKQRSRKTDSTSVKDKLYPRPNDSSSEVKQQYRVDFKKCSGVDAPDQEVKRTASVKVTKVVSRFRSMTKNKLHRNRSVIEPSRVKDEKPILPKRRSLSEADSKRNESSSLQTLLSNPGALIHMYDREEEDKQLRKMIEELSIEYEIRKKRDEEKERKEKDEKREQERDIESKKGMEIVTERQIKSDKGTGNVKEICKSQDVQDVREKTVCRDSNAKTVSTLSRTQRTINIEDDLCFRDLTTGAEDDPKQDVGKPSFFSMLKRLPNQILPGRKSLKKKLDITKKSFSNVSVESCTAETSTEDNNMTEQQCKYSTTQTGTAVDDAVLDSKEEHLKDTACYIEVQAFCKTAPGKMAGEKDEDDETADANFDADVFTSSSAGSVTSLELLDLTDFPAQKRARHLGLSQCSLASTAFTDLSQLDTGCYSDSEICIDDESEMNLVKQEVLASNIRRPLSLDRATFNTNLIPITEDF